MEYIASGLTIPARHSASEILHSLEMCLESVLALWLMPLLLTSLFIFGSFSAWLIAYMRLFTGSAFDRDLISKEVILDDTCLAAFDFDLCNYIT